MCLGFSLLWSLHYLVHHVIQCLFMCLSAWFISKEERNQLLHALFGNAAVSKHRGAHQMAPAVSTAQQSRCGTAPSKSTCQCPLFLIPNAAALRESLPSSSIPPSNMITTSRRLQTPSEPHQVLTRVKVKISFLIAHHSTSRAKAKAKENSPMKAPRKAPRKAPPKALEKAQGRARVDGQAKAISNSGTIQFLLPPYVTHLVSTI